MFSINTIIKKLSIEKNIIKLSDYAIVSDGNFFIGLIVDQYIQKVNFYYMLLILV